MTVLIYSVTGGLLLLLFSTAYCATKLILNGALQKHPTKPVEREVALPSPLVQASQEVSIAFGDLFEQPARQPMPSMMTEVQRARVLQDFSKALGDLFEQPARQSLRSMMAEVQRARTQDLSIAFGDLFEQPARQPMPSMMTEVQRALTLLVHALESNTMASTPEKSHSEEEYLPVTALQIKSPQVEQKSSRSALYEEQPT